MECCLRGLYLIRIYPLTAPKPQALTRGPGLGVEGSGRPRPGKSGLWKTARDSFPDYRVGYIIHIPSLPPKPQQLAMEPKTPLHGTGAEDSAGSEARPVWTLCGLVSLFSCNRNGVDSGKMDSAWI